MIFRNLDVSPDDPVALWGFEGVLTAFERGDLADWHKVYLAYKEDTSGNTRAFINEALDVLVEGEVRPALASVFRLAIAAFDRSIPALFS